MQHIDSATAEELDVEHDRVGKHFKNAFDGGHMAFRLAGNRNAFDIRKQANQSFSDRSRVVDDENAVGLCGYALHAASISGNDASHYRRRLNVAIGKV